MTTKKVVKVVGVCIIVLCLEYLLAIPFGKAIDADNAFQDSIVQPYRQRYKELMRRNAEQEAVQKELETEQRKTVPQPVPQILQIARPQKQVDIARIH